MDGTITCEIAIARNIIVLPGVSECRSFRIFIPNENAGEDLRRAPDFSGAYADGAKAI